MFLKELQPNFFSSSDNKITQIWERGRERERERQKEGGGRGEKERS